MDANAAEQPDSPARRLPRTLKALLPWLPLGAAPPPVSGGDLPILTTKVASRMHDERTQCDAVMAESSTITTEFLYSLVYI